MAEHHVYLLHSEDGLHHKVGICGGQVVQRFRTIQTSCPMRLSLTNVWTLPHEDTARRVEREFLELFLERRGEWIKATYALAMIAMHGVLEECGFPDWLSINWKFRDGPAHSQWDDVMRWERRA